MNRRGLSIPELLVVLGLMVVLMGLGLSRSLTQRPHARALASEVAACLREARQRALTHQQPVGVALPGAAASSLSYLEGIERAKITRTVRFDSEHPNTKLQALSTPTYSAAEQSWLVGHASRPVVIFDARGEASGLRQIGVFGEDRWTVAVDRQGRVTTTSGATEPAVQPALTAPLEPDRPTNHAPRIQQVELSPDVDPSMLNDNIDAVVPYGGFLTLKVRASDPDGDPLFVTWTCTDDEGVFSCPDEQPMSFDGTDWVATNEFRLVRYSSATVGNYRLRCEVRDDPGLRAEDSVSRKNYNVSIGEAGQLAFRATTMSDPDGPVGLYSSAPEGHGVRRLLDRVRGHATVSPDGNHLIWGDGEEGVFVANSDGSEQTQVLAPPYGYGSESPNGGKLAAFHTVPPDYKVPDSLGIFKSDGTPLRSIPVPASATDIQPWLVWDANNRHVYMLYSGYAPAAIEPGRVVGVPLEADSPVVTVRRIDSTDGTYQDAVWPQDAGTFPFASCNPGEVRCGTETGDLYAVRPAESVLACRVRKWEGGGRYQTPVTSSPFDGMTLLLQGTAVDSDDLSAEDSLLGYALWKRNDNRARHLRLENLLLKPFVVWTE